ncbi:MAG: VTT domain-containing protein [Deltaproteobacteria bacterium]|nr:VTT domain-containing protein [Deltaproteobacteria bacterium]
MSSRTIRRAVLGVFGVAFVTGAIYLWRTGAVTPTSVRDWLDSLGPAAPALFVLAFVLGSFVGLPGIAFVIGGGLAFGPWLGLVLGYGGGLLAVTVPFVVARKLRKTEATWTPKNRRLAQVFNMLESHPFRSVLVLRLILWFNPPLSYALAFSKVPIRTYVMACAIALFPVVVLAVVATSWLA